MWNYVRIRRTIEEGTVSEMNWDKAFKVTGTVFFAITAFVHLIELIALI